MTTRPTKRSVRVAARVHEVLMEMLLRGEIRDRHAQGALISRVEMSDDLRHTRVYLRLLDGNAPPRRRDALVRAMNAAKGFVRRELGARLELKYTPDLVFFWDEGVDRVLRVEQLLEEIRADEKIPGPEGDGGAA